MMSVGLQVVEGVIRQVLDLGLKVVYLVNLPSFLGYFGTSILFSGGQWP
jgi:hypothetical protein